MEARQPLALLVRAPDAAFDGWGRAEVLQRALIVPARQGRGELFEGWMPMLAHEVDYRVRVLEGPLVGCAAAADQPVAEVVEDI